MPLFNSNNSEQTNTTMYNQSDFSKTLFSENDNLSNNNLSFEPFSTGNNTNMQDNEIAYVFPSDPDFPSSNGNNTPLSDDISVLFTLSIAYLIYKIARKK